MANGGDYLPPCTTCTYGYYPSYNPYYPSYNPYYSVVVNNGWKCPGCGRCYSPSTMMCSFCGGGSAEITWTNVNAETLPDTITVNSGEDGS